MNNNSLSQAFQENTERFKIFVGMKNGQERLHVLRGNDVELLTHERVEQDVMRYFKKHLPVLTAEEISSLEKLHIRPVTPEPVGDDAAKSKVFVGSSQGRFKLHVLHGDGGVELLTTDGIEPDALDYFKKYLPPLAMEDVALIEGKNFMSRIKVYSPPQP